MFAITATKRMNIMERSNPIPQWCEIEGVELLLSGVVGSRAYGLNTAESDFDRMGIYLTPFTEAVWGAEDKDKGTQVSKGGDDLKMYELRQFLKLYLKGNPNIVEFLWLHDYETSSHIGSKLLNFRSALIIPENITAASLGMAHGAMTRYEKTLTKDADNPSFKLVRHGFRCLIQATKLLKTGELDLKLSLGHINKFKDLEGAPIEDLKYVLETLERNLSEALEDSEIKNTPSDCLALAKQLLSEVRQHQVCSQVAKEFLALNGG